MVFGVLKEKKKRIHQHWTGDDSGYEKTRSTPVINHLLKHLKNQRTPLTIVTDGYQAGPTVLIEITDEKLVLDKPAGWPGKATVKSRKNHQLRVIFRDAARKWNHFDVKVVGNDLDTLYLSVPQTLYRLERRAHYRVSVPSGSSISFSYENARYEKGILNDISAGGMLVSIPDKIQVESKQLKDIDITLPTPEDDIQNIHIGRGEIVRYKHDMVSKRAAIGVAFEVTGKEEEVLLHIVRQQELSLLQKQRQQSAATS